MSTWYKKIPCGVDENATYVESQTSTISALLSEIQRLYPNLCLFFFTVKSSVTQSQMIFSEKCYQLDAASNITAIQSSSYKPPLFSSFVLKLLKKPLLSLKQV